MASILFFGRLADAAGRAQIDAPLPNGVTDLAALIAWVGADRPELAAALAGPGVQVAINQALVRAIDAPLADGDEIAFMPPMSGG